MTEQLEAEPRRRPSVLLVEDDPAKQKLYARSMELAGIDCVYAARDSIQGIVDWAEAEVKRRQFDVLVLDLNMGELQAEDASHMKWGGIELYIEFKRRFILDRCSHIIVASRYTGGGVKGVTTDSSVYVVKVFMELADIPYRNLFELLRGGGFDQVIDRINDLTGP